MAKELGNVKVVHGSGMVETDKGIRSMITAKVGDRLVMDEDTRVVSVAVKITEKTNIDIEDYNTLDVASLKEKFNLKELKAIAKQEGRKNYSKLKEEELANLIIFDDITGEQKDTELDDATGDSDDDIKTGTDDATGDE
jgi:formate-dependent nitrite reductase cytochrome c552 subunit